MFCLGVYLCGRHSWFSLLWFCYRSLMFSCFLNWNGFTAGPALPFYVCFCHEANKTGLIIFLISCMSWYTVRALYDAYNLFLMCSTEACQIPWSHTCFKLHWSIVTAGVYLTLLHLLLILVLKRLRMSNHCAAGWHWRWEGAAEEVDHFLESSAVVLTAWRRLPLQHNPGHVCAHAQPRGLEEHRVLWSLHISVVRPSITCFNTLTCVWYL